MMLRRRRLFSTSAQPPRAAQMLVQARRTRQMLPHIPATVRPTTLDEVCLRKTESPFARNSLCIQLIQGPHAWRQAYQVQWEGWAATLAQYDTRRIGHKVAATSAMAQASVNMTHPFAGALFSHSTLGYSDARDNDVDDSDVSTGGHRTWRLSAASFGEFRLIEPEFGLVLRSSIEPGTAHTADTVPASLNGSLHLDTLM